ncbi:MAG: hypothetical protein ACI8XO_000829 [Verrucomicrobiales bacterium]
MDTTGLDRARGGIAQIGIGWELIYAEDRGQHTFVFGEPLNVFGERSFTFSERLSTLRAFFPGFGGTGNWK